MRKVIVIDSLKESGRTSTVTHWEEPNERVIYISLELSIVEVEDSFPKSDRDGVDGEVAHEEVKAVMMGEAKLILVSEETP